MTSGRRSSRRNYRRKGHPKTRELKPTNASGAAIVSVVAAKIEVAIHHVLTRDKIGSAVARNWPGCQTLGIESMLDLGWSGK